MTSHREADAPQPILFDAELRPHRSLNRRGFALLMALFGGVSLIVGLAFLAVGAWPVFGFFGLDVLLLWFAFRLSYRDARARETFRLTEGELRVARIDADGRQCSWSFQPYWLRISYPDPPEPGSQVVLSSHGRSLGVASFLPVDEKVAFAKSLRAAVASLRDLRHQP